MLFVLALSEFASTGDKTTIRTFVRHQPYKLRHCAVLNSGFCFISKLTPSFLVTHFRVEGYPELALAHRILNMRF
ncbi:hypothetical protein BWQ96_04813 [Gracilariopsis chorda]|uniref:Uncharacterized protein n=1 Tax=Gracilariopsis chorda TaxID=448386 RepID=A0A2V3ITE4_9FLOR|nr:hypothetical protein BWQ96_04813 [Gracilariopsis chorda]|eukprot:PXF45398.1 hypothetical protein BWQ96_04813 [Gracilariopsis chorda]